ncbi:MAG: hypothetical protein B7X04_01705 [Parcubacteria group bacterium 21-54-25]|nr:MAG: hypothetical protein B7X04_01705 [Parcubacteria group bacterium 21-54-25]HQU07709.1 Asp-tRNA(Asn)/Glu-tRNA(Gln) amidotransferase subunit GatC [Candidatus Paceibacterota bacterium]
MASADDVKKLAALARVSVSEEALPRFVKEFDSILSYIGQIESLALVSDGAPAVPLLRNVFRDDEQPTPPGTNTQALAESFPERKGNALSVKQILIP